MYRINIIFTFHNRKSKTGQCLESLIQQKGKGEIFEIKVFCCDDGSTDGTSELLKEIIPQINIVKGSGNLFWARGMALACEIAENTDADFYLMINDDVEFNNDMIIEMLDSYKKGRDLGCECAIVGPTCDKNEKFTYGGTNWYCNGFTINSNIVIPNRTVQKCNIANWNCFLIPTLVYKIVGKIDRSYSHGLADYDYSLRICESGFNIYSSMNYVGYCERNPIVGTYMDKGFSKIHRLVLMQKRTAKPIRSDLHFFCKHFGAKGIVFVFKQYLGILIE